MSRLLVINLKKILRSILLPIVDIVENRVKQTNWYKNVIPNKENYPDGFWYRKHLDRNYDIVNLGSSSALYAFNYEDLSIKAFNWALKPQSMEYSFKILKNYFSILKKGGIVIIPYSPFSGLSVDGKWDKTANDKYYHILDPSLIESYQQVYKRRRFPFLCNPFKSIFRIIHDVPEIRKEPYSTCSLDDGNYEKNAELYIKNWKKEFNINDLNLPLTKELEISSLKRRKTICGIIEFCLERELRPVIVIPPVHMSLNVYFSEMFVKNYIYNLIEQANKYEIRVLDYLKDNRFMNNKYFYNSFFLNTKGAKVFTAQVLYDLGMV